MKQHFSTISQFKAKLAGLNQPRHTGSESSPSPGGSESTRRQQLPPHSLDGQQPVVGRSASDRQQPVRHVGLQRHTGRALLASSFRAPSTHILDEDASVSNNFHSTPNSRSLNARNTPSSDASMESKHRIDSTRLTATSGSVGMDDELRMLIWKVGSWRTMGLRLWKCQPMPCHTSFTFPLFSQRRLP